MAKIPKKLNQIFKECLFFLIVFLILSFKLYLDNRTPEIKLSLKLKQSYFSVSHTSNSSKYSCFESHLRQLPSYAIDYCATNNSCENLTCYDIIFNTSSPLWVKTAKKINGESFFQSDASYHNLSCPNFRSSRNFSMSPLSEESAKYPIAFNILLHKSASQFEVLLQSIYRPQNSYCIHLDGKAGESLQKAIVKIVGCFPNVFMASRYELVWCGVVLCGLDVVWYERVAVQVVNLN